MRLSAFANKYFNDSKIWEVGKKDQEEAEQIIFSLVNLVDALRVLLRPYLPEAFKALSKLLGVDIEEVQTGKNLWLFRGVKGYPKLDQVVPLFKKIDKEVVLKVKQPKEETKIDKRALYEQVKLVEIIDINKHPNADKLSVVKIYDGKSEFEIVTGASNMKVGDIVAYLGVGGIVPGWLINEGKKVVLEPKDLRGVVSNGMLLSDDELGIGNDHSGIRIIETTDDKIGKSFPEIYEIQ